MCLRHLFESSAKPIPYLFTIHYYLLPKLKTGFGTEHLSPVQVAALEAHDEHFSGGQVGGDGDVLLVAVADGLDHLGIVPGVGGIGVGEQQHQVDLVVSDAGVDLLVTGPGPAAVRDAARVGELLELMGKTNVRLVVNRIIPRMVSAMETTIDDVMDTAGLPLLGIIPEDKNMTLAAVFSRPLLIYSRRSGASDACTRISKRLQGIPVPISLR